MMVLFAWLLHVYPLVFIENKRKRKRESVNFGEHSGRQGRIVVLIVDRRFRQTHVVAMKDKTPRKGSIIKKQINDAIQGET
ncbi:hypothetical protein QVD17_36853 [Tagetes erecta]|uniref:Uncharacterized protein n=1 Tax=Tagetes erecta TaxID=13708 RepID=A0AAD8JUV4_TARER|nr:hypothetical protein QVD17_36853 [Tagetes erecta]